MEFVIDEILFIHFKSKVFNDIRFEKKIEILKEFQIINSDLYNDLVVFYKIRNIFAHEIIFNENKIINLLKSFKTVDSKNMSNNFNQKLEEIGHAIRRNIEKEYSKMLGMDSNFSKILLKIIQ